MILVEWRRDLQIADSNQRCVRVIRESRHAPNSAIFGLKLPAARAVINVCVKGDLAGLHHRASICVVCQRVQEMLQRRGVVVLLVGAIRKGSSALIRERERRVRPPIALDLPHYSFAHTDT